MDHAKITEFSGEHRWLSNFWMTPVPFEGHVYPSVEHAYQAAKTLNDGDRTHIRLFCGLPGQAKRFGQKLALRHDWHLIRLKTMDQLLREKFKDPDLRAKLVATYPRFLEEGNTWGDTYWGVCDGKGANFLGLLLMKLRDEFTGET